MGEQQHSLTAGAPGRPEPSWPAVLATTLRLWLERHVTPDRTRHRVGGQKAGQKTGQKASAGGRRRAVAVALSVLLAAALGAGITAVVTRDGQQAAGAEPARGSDPLQEAAQVRAQAAAWIAQQVSPGAIVACDPAMCSALQVAGLALGRLLVLQPATPDPLGSDVVVATPPVREQFGARLASVYAPLVIASFGSGAGRIDVRAVTPDGAAALQAQLASDLRARISAGRQLLRNAHVQATAPARAALLAGQADPRLLVTLSALAARMPLRLVAFGDASPGASPGIPLRGAEIAAPQAGGLAAMLAFLKAQRSPYLPAKAGIVGSAAGEPVLTVQFNTPGPLGLGGP
ncbi:MAG: hypothetical protein JO132_10425 [Streptosporangiaceae bacterium]|nr:hypothetical protein [Streptosporangiaceae bacterium]